MAWTGYADSDDVDRKDDATLDRFDGDTALLNSSILACSKRVNELLDQRFHVPIPVNSDGTYDQALIDATCWFVVAEGRRRKGMTESADNARQQALDIIDDVNAGRRALQSQVTLDELGIGGISPGDDNTSSGRFELDRLTSRYLGDVRADYVVTIGTGGASGTATYSVTKDGTALATGTTADSWIGLENGIRFRFVGSASGSFVAGDTFSFICQPSRQAADVTRARSVRLLDA